MPAYYESIKSSGALFESHNQNDRNSEKNGQEPGKLNRREKCRLRIGSQRFLLPVVRDGFRPNNMNGFAAGSAHIYNGGAEGKAENKFREQEAEDRCEEPIQELPGLPVASECKSSATCLAALRFFTTRFTGYQRIAKKAIKIEASIPSTTAIVPAPAPGPI